MRAVVKVKQSQGRTPSNATRYIAGSKLDPEREGDKPRSLFTNEDHEDLTYRKADGFLSDGHGAPVKNDLIHFSVSFLNEDFEALGSNDEERKDLLREAAREAMDEFRSDLRVSDWRWVVKIAWLSSAPTVRGKAPSYATSWLPSLCRTIALSTFRRKSEGTMPSRSSTTCDGCRTIDSGTS